MERKKIFRSLEEMEAYYFPRMTEQRMIDNMSEEELVQYLVEKSIKKLRKYMNS